MDRLSDYLATFREAARCSRSHSLRRFFVICFEHDREWSVEPDMCHPGAGLVNRIPPDTAIHETNGYDKWLRKSVYKRQAHLQQW